MRQRPATGSEQRGGKCRGHRFGDATAKEENVKRVTRQANIKRPLFSNNHQKQRVGVCLCLSKGTRLHPYVGTHTRLRWHREKKVRRQWTVKGEAEAEAAVEVEVEEVGF